jgi:hypothetical protein
MGMNQSEAPRGEFNHHFGVVVAEEVYLNKKRTRRRRQLIVARAVGTSLALCPLARPAFLEAVAEVINKPRPDNSGPAAIKV